jgi:predicted  nucleic acid-binding Zn-ribbon protein
VYEVTISEPVKKSPKKKTFANGKAKLYAVKPLADPSAEKARLNAINAKKNRDFKKREKEIIAQEVASLRHENGTLKKTAAAMRKRAAEAESELRRLQAAIRSNQLEDVIKAAGKKHNESDKLSFLDITSSSDTDLQSLWS